MHEQETPVFFDKSGKRWRTTENVIIVLTACIGIIIYWLAPLVLSERQPAVMSSSSQQTSAKKSTPEVSHLMSTLAPKNIAVIGSGLLVRLVAVSNQPDGNYATDPFSNTKLGKLTPEDTKFINGDEYALQRYGEIGEKRLYLTFDDGPDPTYTPEILNLLSSESVPATFFVTGDNVAKFPEIARRITSEGHAIGNHTLSHINLDVAGKLRGEQEINQTQRLIVAATEHNTAFFRPPYGGNSDQSLRNSLKSILIAQRLGYTVASYNFDTDDWKFTAGKKPEYPILDGSSRVILMHDGGGDRTKTVAYVSELIRRAKSSGYSFSNLNNILRKTPKSSQTPQVTVADRTSLLLARSVLVWPHQLIGWLFVFSVGMFIIVSLINILLAIFYRLSNKRRRYSKSYRPHVTIILPAYNEEKVIEKSVKSLIRSRYKKISIIIVDDGSTDNTWPIARKLARRYKRVAALHQVNAGKAAALNNAISHSSSEIVICVDADTLFSDQTVLSLVRHFEDQSVGAVAGVVKVGNADGILTKWQALEYISGISIERSAQALLGAIMIVPGACGAWRQSALVEVGGFSSSTLAEDCDLALKIQATNRYKILQDNTATSYTEAPGSVRALTKQRFRWTFGNLQSLWKHRNMMFKKRYGWLGMYVLPSMVIAILVPILFWPLVIYLTILNILAGNYLVIVIFFVLSLMIQILTSVIGTALAKERYSYLLAIPFARFAYGPIRMYILYKTIFTILQGVDVGWNKLARTGTVSTPITAKLAPSTIRPRKT